MNRPFFKKNEFEMKFVRHMQALAAASGVQVPLSRP